MDTLAGQGVEVTGQNGNQGLAFTGAHLSDPALVQNDAAHELHRVGAHTQHPVGGLPNGGEGLRQNVIQGFPGFQTILEDLGLALQGILRQFLVFLLQGQDFIHNGLDLFDFPLRAGTEQFVEKSHDLLL